MKIDFEKCYRWKCEHYVEDPSFFAGNNKWCSCKEGIDYLVPGDDIPGGILEITG